MISAVSERPAALSSPLYYICLIKKFDYKQTYLFVIGSVLSRNKYDETNAPFWTKV